MDGCIKNLQQFFSSSYARIVLHLNSCCCLCTCSEDREEDCTVQRGHPGGDNRAWTGACLYRRGEFPSVTCISKDLYYDISKLLLANTNISGVTKLQSFHMDCVDLTFHMSLWPF